MWTALISRPHLLVKPPTKTVEQMGTQLISMAAKIPDNQSLALQNVEGRVADVTGREVIVNVGKQNGIAPGDHLSVDRPYKTIKDPVTGKTLKEMRQHHRSHQNQGSQSRQFHW